MIARKRPVKGRLFTPIRLNNIHSVRNIPLKNLTWPQAAIRFPRMLAFGDKDRDGVPNMLDCRPFNRRKHDDINFDIGGKVVLPTNMTRSDISHERVEKTQAEKDEILKNIIFKRLRQEFHEEKRKGNVPEDENYFEWVSERKAKRESKEAKYKSNVQKMRDLGLLDED